MSFGNLGQDIILLGLNPPVLPVSTDYKAVINPKTQRSVVGAVIQFDASASSNPNGNPLDCYWSFSAVPIGSQVAKYGFLTRDPNALTVNFSPDITGFYRVSLVVTDGFFISEPVEAEVYIQVIMVPHGQGLVPDAKFLWNYLSDFWKVVKGREKMENIWSSSLQLIANNLLNLYQLDYNKSIKDIEDYFQRKWLSYNPRLDLDDTTFILADDQAGNNLGTGKLGVFPEPPYTNTAIIPTATDGSFTTTKYGQAIGPGRLLTIRSTSYRKLRSTEGTLFGTGLSIFTSEKENIPTGLGPISWRFSSTLKSENINFETAGVMGGDILAVEVSKSGTNLKSVLKLQVVGVADNSLSFTFNLDPLVAGVAAGGLTYEQQLQLAQDLRVGDIVKAFDGTVLYSGEAQKIYDTVRTVTFKRTFFEKVLTTDQDINIGPISIRVKPLYVIRNTRIPVDLSLVSVPVLQEFIQQPVIQEIDGKLYEIIEDESYPIEQKPKVLFENLDYIIDKEDSVTGVCTLVAGDNKISIPFGDLLDRKITEHDKLVIDEGLNKNTYRIDTIVNSTTITVTPTPQASEKNRKFKIIRHNPGKFIRFASGAFSISKPAPEILWGEVSYFDNSNLIENNFGVLVGLSKEELDVLKITPPYKAAVAGLMYSFANGPTIKNLRLGAQILLGLPFTYHKGVITDINMVYRTLESGAPQYGRILIAAIDERGKKTGLTNIYLFPRGKQIFNIITMKWEDQDPDFSGIDINPATGKPYAIGDVVEQFAILSKGVDVQDYLVGPGWYDTILSQADIAFVLRKYHSAYLRANTDVFSTDDLDFVVTFIRKTKPHYVQLSVAALKSFADDVNITDELWFKPIYTFVDSVGISLPAAAKFDDWYDTPNYISVDGTMYCRYIYGYDLATNQANKNLISAGGGFVTARANEFHDSPFIQPGDLVVITQSLNAGKYPVLTVANDTTITVDTTITFKTLQDQRFAIFRPISNPIYKGKVDIVPALPDITLSGGTGPFSAGIAPGDMLYFFDPLAGTISRQYYITQFDATTKQIAPPPVENPGNYDVRIIRPALTTKFLGAAETDTPYKITTSIANPLITFSSGFGLDKLPQIKIDDVIYAEGHPPYTILDFNEVTLEAFVHPIPAVDDALRNAKVWRPWLPNTSFSVNTVDRLKNELVYLELRCTTHPCETFAPPSRQVNVFENLLTLGIKPGDFIKFNNLPNSNIDMGYGLGIVPIADVTGITTLQTTRPVIGASGQNEFSLIKVFDS